MEQTYILKLDSDNPAMSELLKQLNQQNVSCYPMDARQEQEIQRILDTPAHQVPELESGVCKQAPAEQPPKRPKTIRVHTFGHFEVFVDGNPLTFKREKAKELMAYLVDRHGASLTTQQIAFALWEDLEYNRSLKNKVTRTLSSLRETLREAGIEDLLIKSWNHLSLDTSKITCDAYEFEHQKPSAVNAFRGEYMVNYSWAEYTTGEYVQMQQSRKKRKTGK